MCARDVVCVEVPATNNILLENGCLRRQPNSKATKLADGEWWNNQFRESRLHHNAKKTLALAFKCLFSVQLPDKSIFANF